MELSQLIVAWSIRLSMLLFALYFGIRWISQPGRVPSLGVKLLWTVSFLLFVLHVVAAFHFVHHWSHERAFEATRQETRELIGWEFGYGVYFNYAFLLIWGLDLFRTWFPPRDHLRIWKWVLGLGVIYLLFIAWNGIVVFKSGWIRASGVLITFLLLCILFRKVGILRSIDRREQSNR